MSLPDNYVGLSPLYCGRVPTTPVGTPAWMTTAGVALNKAVVIPSITNGGGAVMIAWGSFDIRQSTGEIFVGPQAGHGDGYYNGVTKFSLNSDSPAWVTCIPATPFAQVVPDVNYNADGKPVARHMYDHWHWDPITDQFVMIGGFGSYIAGNEVTASDSFDPVTDTWIASGTWPFIGGTGYSTAIDTLRGNLWTNGLRRVSTTSKTYLAASITQTVNVRYPMVYDSQRDQMFSLMWGGGQSPSSVLSAGVFSCTGSTQQAITFNTSTAYNQFVDDALLGAYAGMTYDPDLDVFYWYSGNGAAQGRLYVITPNNTTVWDMTLFIFATGSTPLDATTAGGSGINGRIKYHKLLKGIVINPSGSGSWFFIKTSN